MTGDRYTREAVQEILKGLPGKLINTEKVFGNEQAPEHIVDVHAEWRQSVVAVRVITDGGRTLFIDFPLAEETAT